jgi:hypothetical protein
MSEPRQGESSLAAFLAKYSGAKESRKRFPKKAQRTEKPKS